MSGAALLRNTGSTAGDPAFDGSETMLNSDQGVRGFLYVLNDLCFLEADNLALKSWSSESGTATSVQAVSRDLQSLSQEAVGEFVRQLVVPLASYDWRSSKAESLRYERDLRQAKVRFREAQVIENYV